MTTYNDPLFDAGFFQALPTGYAAIRKDGVIAGLNLALAGALGYTVGELIGQQSAEFPFDETNRRLFLEQLARRASGVADTYELQLRGRENQRIAVACFAAPQYDSDGSYWGSRGIVVPFAELERFSSFANGFVAHVSQAPASSVRVNGARDEHVERLLGSLTRRERDVVDLLRSGLRVQGVAECLSLSHYTVRNHLKRIFRKAGVTSQGELLMKLNGPMRQAIVGYEALER